jgi:hypothetical protein
MRTCVALTDRLQSILGKLVPGLSIATKVSQLLRHLNAILHYQIVLAGTKEVFLVRPG